MVCRCCVIEKFCASTTGLNVVGGSAAAGTARTARTTSVAITPARSRNIAMQIVPSRAARQSVTRHASGAGDCAFAHTPGMAVLSRAEVLRRIVDRTDLELFTDRVLDSFWEQ